MSIRIMSDEFRNFFFNVGHLLEFEVLSEVRNNDICVYIFKRIIKQTMFYLFANRFIT